MQANQDRGMHLTSVDPNYKWAYGICRLAVVFQGVRFPANRRLPSPQSDRQVSVDTFGRDGTQRAPALWLVPHGDRHDGRREEVRREVTWGGEDKKCVRLLDHWKKDWNPLPERRPWGEQIEKKNHFKYWRIFLGAIIVHTATTTTHPTQLGKNKKKFRSQEDKDSAGVCAAVFMGE